MINTAIIYCRVSTNKQKKDWESLENQEKICRDFCQRNNIQVLWVFKEAYTWTSSSRPILDEAILNAKTNKVTHFIIFDIDRFSREWTEAYFSLKNKLEKLNIKLRDTKNIIGETSLAINNDIIDMSEYAWNKVSASEYAETILSTVAKEERKKILQRTISREIQLEQEGYHVKPANYGFKNAKIDTPNWKKPIQIEDPFYWLFVREMFELKAWWIMSDNEIVKQINIKWCKRKNWKPMTVVYMQEIIKKPVYAWIISSKWTGYKAIKTKYKWLVDIETWNKANRWKLEIIQNWDEVIINTWNFKEKRINIKNTENEQYLFSWLLKYQGFAMRAYISKKTGWIYYREASGVKPTLNISQNDIEAKIIEDLASYNLPEIFKEDFVNWLLERFEILNWDYKKRKKESEKEIHTLLEESKEVAKRSIKGQITTDIALEIQQDNEKRIIQLKKVLSDSEKSEMILSTQVVELFEMFTQSQNLWNRWDLNQKRLLLKLFMVELSLEWWEDKQKQLYIANTELFWLIKKINFYLLNMEWHPH